VGKKRRSRWKRGKFIVVAATAAVTAAVAGIPQQQQQQNTEMSSAVYVHALPPTTPDLILWDDFVLILSPGRSLARMYT
jgi:hypothetical protein